MFLSCPHCSRRDFLSTLGGGFGAVALNALLQMESRAEIRIDPINPFAPREPHFKPKAKSVIFLFMVGGPSQVDTFDYKPELQKLDGKPVPESIKQALKSSRHANVFQGCEDKLLGSPYKWSQHGSSGMWVSELFPENGEARR
jgi:hypothetical protein